MNSKEPETRIKLLSALAAAPFSEPRVEEMWLGLSQRRRAEEAKSQGRQSFLLVLGAVMFGGLLFDRLEMHAQSLPASSHPALTGGHAGVPVQLERGTTIALDTAPASIAEDTHPSTSTDKSSAHRALSPKPKTLSSPGTEAQLSASELSKAGPGRGQSSVDQAHLVALFAAARRHELDGNLAAAERGFRQCLEADPPVAIAREARAGLVRLRRSVTLSPLPDLSVRSAQRTKGDP